MTKHKHAELMMQYAQDAMETDKPWERWEFRWEGEEDWRRLFDHPSWQDNANYRRETPTHIVNGHEVPAPLKGEPDIGSGYFYIDTYSMEACPMRWDGDSIDTRLLGSNCFARREDALQNMKAMFKLDEYAEKVE